MKRSVIISMIVSLNMVAAEADGITLSYRNIWCCDNQPEIYNAGIQRDCISNYFFCEHTDSLCISRGIHPETCETLCKGAGAIGYVTGFFSKWTFLTWASTTRLSPNPPCCEMFSCQYLWFPSCDQQYNCCSDTLASHPCGVCTAWCSSGCLLAGCIFTSCLLGKNCCEKYNN